MAPFRCDEGGLNAPDPKVVIYWDASAVLSALFLDMHSKEAIAWLQKPGFHLLSSLAWAEVQAVIARVQREKALAGILIEAARKSVDSGPWRQLNMVPTREMTRNLATKWSLRGADLWHLATANTVKSELPELTLLTFDQRLKDAAIGEGLG